VIEGFAGWKALIDLALAEDIGSGDLTTLSTVPAETLATGVMTAKSPGVISGLEAAAYALWRVDPRIGFTPKVQDGDAVAVGDVVAELSGPARSILTGERIALNLLQRLSGVATITAQFVAEIAGTGATIVDTRKTTPGLRELEKAAVRHGGGHNHRFGLSDGVLIKDNHLAAIGGADRVTKAIAAARLRAPHTVRIEVEVTTLAEVEEAAAARADIIMFDNMSNEMMKEAGQIVAKRAITEASGGVRLETVRKIAETGVDLISVGALTHSAPSVDISLTFALGDN
jgi:nicotinate-nucleotide pyrophosphorylase (carboxylating)